MATDEKNIYEEMEEGISDEYVEETSVTTETKGVVSASNGTTPEEDYEDVAPASLDLSDVDIGDIELEDSDDESDIVSSEEKLRLFSDQIIASCIEGKSIQKYAIDKLMSITNPQLFRDENYILFSIFYFYRSKLMYI